MGRSPSNGKGRSPDKGSRPSRRKAPRRALSRRYSRTTRVRAAMSPRRWFFPEATTATKPTR